MPTERYQAPYGKLDAADGAVKALTVLHLMKWARRWVIWLPIAFIISMLDPVMAPLKWWALGFAGASLAFILLTSFFLRRKTTSVRAHVVDVEAKIHEWQDMDEDEVIDLKPIGGPDER